MGASASRGGRLGCSEGKLLFCAVASMAVVWADWLAALLMASLGGREVSDSVALWVGDSLSVSLSQRGSGEGSGRGERSGCLDGVRFGSALGRHL